MKTLIIISAAFFTLNCSAQMIVTGVLFQSKESKEIKKGESKKDSIQVVVKQVKAQDRMLKEMIAKIREEKKKNLTQNK